MYSDKEFEFIDNLLRNSLNNDFTYDKLCYSRDFNYDLYEKLFTDINKDPYKLIELHETTFTITTLGRQVAIIGFKEYLQRENDKSDLEKQIKVLTLKNIKWTSIRGWIAIGISILALIVASLTYINKYNETKDNNTNTKTNPTNNTIDSVKVDTLSNNNIINKNTVSTKIIPYSSKH